VVRWPERERGGGESGRARVCRPIDTPMVGREGTSHSEASRGRDAEQQLDEGWKQVAKAAAGGPSDRERMSPPTLSEVTGAEARGEQRVRDSAATTAPTLRQCAST